MKTHYLYLKFIGDRHTVCFHMAGDTRIKLVPTESKSVVLSLHQSPTFGGGRGYRTLLDTMLAKQRRSPLLPPQLHCPRFLMND